jgi:hypothetical protein
MAIQEVTRVERVRVCDLCRTPRDAVDRRTIDVCSRHDGQLERNAKKTARARRKS